MAADENIMLADLGIVRHENLPLQGHSSDDGSFDIDRPSPRRATISHPSEAMALQRNVAHGWKNYLSFQPEEHRDRQAERMREGSSLGSGQSHRLRMQASLLSDFRDNISTYYSARGNYRGDRGGGQAGRAFSRGGRGHGRHGSRGDRGESSIPRDIPGHTGYQAVQRGIIGIRSHAPLPRGMSSNDRSAWEAISGNVGLEKAAPDTTQAAPIVARGATRGPFVARGRGSYSGDWTSASSQSTVVGGYLADKNRPRGRPSYRPSRRVTTPNVTVTRAPASAQSSRKPFDPARLNEAGFLAANGIGQQGAVSTESIVPRKSASSLSTHGQTGSSTEFTQLPGFGNAAPVDKGKQVDKHPVSHTKIAGTSSQTQPEAFMHAAASDSRGSGSGLSKVNSLVTPDRPVPTFEPFVEFEAIKVTSPKDKQIMRRPLDLEVDKSHDKGKGKQVERLASPFQYDTLDRWNVEGKQFTNSPVGSDDNRVRDPMRQKDFDSVLEKSRSLAEGIKSAKRESGHLHPTGPLHMFESEASTKSNSDGNGDGKGKIANLTLGEDRVSVEVRGTAVPAQEPRTKDEEPNKPQGECKDFLDIFATHKNKKSEPIAAKSSGSSEYRFDSTIKGDLKGLLFQNSSHPGQGSLEHHGSSGNLPSTEPWSGTSNEGRENAVNVIAGSNNSYGEATGVLSSNAISTIGSQSVGPTSMRAMLATRDGENESRGVVVIDENFLRNLQGHAPLPMIRSKSDIYREIAIGNIERRLREMADELAKLSAIDALITVPAETAEPGHSESQEDPAIVPEDTLELQQKQPAPQEMPREPSILEQGREINTNFQAENSFIPRSAVDHASIFPQGIDRIDPAQDDDESKLSLIHQMFGQAYDALATSTSLQPAKHSVDLEANAEPARRGPMETALAAIDAHQTQQMAQIKPQKRPNAFAENGIYSSRYADTPPHQSLGMGTQNRVSQESTSSARRNAFSAGSIGDNHTLLSGDRDAHNDNPGTSETQNWETRARQQNNWFGSETCQNRSRY